MSICRPLVSNRVLQLLYSSYRKAPLCLPAKNQVRQSHTEWSYRKLQGYPEASDFYPKTLSAIFWWWILWHLFTEYEELGSLEFPDPSKFTDEELGIPPIE